MSDLFDLSARKLTTRSGIDTEELTGKTFPYQFDAALVDDVDLQASTPGDDLNWLEDIHLMHEDGMPAVFDRYTNAFLKIHFPIPEGREDEYARKVLIKHLQEGNSYGIWLKHRHAKFPQPELGSWSADSAIVGENWSPPRMEGWEPPAGH
ncbi:MAG: hypothetical protein L0I76_03970 [Pseudonocardia sp.]|nr:hypothetical protein [Pseudonocardia sp.]